MRTRTRWMLSGFGILFILFVAVALYFSWQLVRIGTAYKAKILCSGVFVAKRDPQSILAADLVADDLSPMRYFEAKVDYQSQSVTAALWGMAERKAVYRPGLGCILAQGATEADYWAFPRRALFDRIGMRSTILEPDASGTLVGSSFMYATARDWARFGLLYLQDGRWAGHRILPEGWVRYSRTPTPQAPRENMGPTSG